MKKILSVLCLTIILLSSLTAAAPMPNTTFTLVQGLPATMKVGETYTVIVQIESDQEFIFAQAMPSFYYPGRGVVAVQSAENRSGRGTSATLAITYKAKGSTASFQDVAPYGAAHVQFVAGVRYPGGYTAVQDFAFYVTVP